MEAVREGKQNIVTDLRKAASDLTVVLDEYRRQEAAVLRESDSYDKSFAGISVDHTQKRINGIEPRPGKIQEAINKPR